MKLLEIRLPAGDIDGLDLGLDPSFGWTGNNRHRFDEEEWEGYDGLRLIGARRGTRIRSLHGDASLNIGRRAGHVELEGVTIHSGLGGGNTKVVFAGIDAANRADLIPLTVALRNVELVAETRPDGRRPTWGLFTNQADLTLEGVLCEGFAELSEHGLYAHGFARLGVRIARLHMDGVGAEGLKFTCRPGPQWVDPTLPQWLFPHAFGLNGKPEDWYHPTPGASIVLEDVFVADWNQPHSWRGGAGITIQGAAAKVVGRRVVLVGRAGDSKPALAIDDSGHEHYGPDGVGGHSPASRVIAFSDSLFAAGPGGGNTSPVVSMTSLTGNTTPPGSLAEGVLFERCGVFGERMYVQLRGVKDDQILWKENNSPEVITAARAAGIDVSHEAELQVNQLARRAASADFASGPATSIP